MSSKFDDLLTQLGTGKWNIIFFFTCAFWSFLVPSQFLNGVYVAPSISYTCRPPPDVNATSVNSCSYSINGSSGVEEEIPCSEWDYDTSVFTSTLTSEFNLVCEREILQATYQGMYMLGTFVSPLLGGYLADRYGRLAVAVSTQVILTISSIGIVFLPNFTLILATRFIMGVVSLLTLFVLAMEVCEPKKRSTVGILIGLPWALGSIWWGAAAYFIRDWRWLQLSVALPTLLIFPFMYLMDESPRWLIVVGQHEKALKALQKAARWNKATLPPESDLYALMAEIQKESATGQHKTKPGDKDKRCSFLRLPAILSTREITIITVVVCYAYFAVSLVFDGLNLSGATFSADPFLYIILGGVMEIPGYSLTAPLIQRFGRRWPTSASFLIGGVLILALAFIPTDISWLVMTLAMSGKLCISGSFQIIYVYSTELFPTEVRSQAIGAASVFSQLASVILPYITTVLGPILPWLPSLLFGGSSLIAGFATLALKETLNMPLPDTITDLKKTRKAKLSSGEGDEREMEAMDTKN
ncbi:organic cation transporter protein-like [Penaeus japonicus]|uniref:organic cation transporter protein-like n=1 Tax=Penaeus japonicus TaxID=27405 RepID=UPI001C712EEC|nr:organic cation transporter protein-like [Penaeus japonicus]